MRKAFQAALESVDHVAPSGLVEFYSACAQYMVFSMARLHEQDQKIHDLLEARIPAAEADAHARLDELGQRQDRSRALMDEFSGLTQRLAAEGVAGLPKFEQGARDFAANFTALLAPRKNPFHAHTDQLFTDGDWHNIAGATNASVAEEVALFEAVTRYAPRGIDPAAMTVEHS